LWHNVTKHVAAEGWLGFILNVFRRSRALDCSVSFLPSAIEPDVFFILEGFIDAVIVDYVSHGGKYRFIVQLRNIQHHRTTRISGPARDALISNPTRPPASLHAIVCRPFFSK
jgi:hypothetical protein